MNKFSKILISMAGLALAMPLLAATPPSSANMIDCGIGSTVPGCNGAWHFGNDHQWGLPSVSAASASAESVVMSIGPGAELDIPYYSVGVPSGPGGAGTTTTWYAGPGRVTRWELPPGANASALVIPNQAGLAGSTTVTVSTTWEGPYPAQPTTTRYAIDWPALNLRQLHTYIGGATTNITETSGTGPENTVAAEYRANESVLAFSREGPWKKSALAQPGQELYIENPSHPAGLVLTATPVGTLPSNYYYAHGNSGFLAAIAPEAATTPIPKPTPNPKPKVVPAIPTPTLKIVAPTRKQVGQPIPATITILRNGHPDARALVAASTTTGKLSRTAGRTNARGQIYLTITRAPIGRLAITAITGKARGQAVVRVVPKPASPFPWWSLLGLLGLVLLGILVVIASIRNWRRWPHR